MSLKKTILCDLLGWHNYEDSRVQRDTGYRRKECARCGEATYDPR